MDDFEEVDNTPAVRSSYRSQPVDDAGYPTREELESLIQVERIVHPEETPEEMSERILRTATPQAAMSIVQMACDRSTPASTRLRAAQYVVDRALGRPGDGSPTMGKKTPWDDFFEGVIVETTEPPK